MLSRRAAACSSTSLRAVRSPDRPRSAAFATLRARFLRTPASRRSFSKFFLPIRRSSFRGRCDRPSATTGDDRHSVRPRLPIERCAETEERADDPGRPLPPASGIVTAAPRRRVGVTAPSPSRLTSGRARERRSARCRRPGSGCARCSGSCCRSRAGAAAPSMTWMASIDSHATPNGFPSCTSPAWIGGNETRSGSAIAVRSMIRVLSRKPSDPTSRRSIT